MIDFSYSTEITVNASPQAIFDIVSNPTRHVDLAGSTEFSTMRQEPAGPVGTGTHFHAEETIKMADGSGMDLTADAIGALAGLLLVWACGIVLSIRRRG